MTNPPNKLTKEELIEDLRKTQEKTGGILTVEKYLEHGEHCMGAISHGANPRWDTWNEAKKEAGLEIIEKGNSPGKAKDYSDKEILYNLKYAYRRVPGMLSFHEFDYLAEMCHQTAVMRFGSWTVAKKAAGVYDREKNHVFSEWADYLKEEYGYGKVSTMKIAEDCINYDSYGIKEFVEWNKEQDNNLKIRGYKPNSNKGHGVIFIKPEDKNFEEVMIEKYGHFIDEDYHHILKDIVGQGFSPHGVTAAIKYLTEDGTQKEIAGEVGCSGMTIRNCRDKILEEGYFSEEN